MVESFQCVNYITTPPYLVMESLSRADYVTEWPLVRPDSQLLDARLQNLSRKSANYCQKMVIG